MAPTCDDYQSVLPILVDAELAGQSPALTYPQLWAHLQTCADCRADYAMLLDVLRAEREGRPIPLPDIAMPALPFLGPEPPWRIHFQPSRACHRHRLVFAFNLDHLRDAIRPPQLATRNDDGGGRLPLSVLLSDIITWYGQEWAVVVTGEQQPDQATLSVRASVAGRAELPIGLWGILTWGEETREAPVDAEGQVDFGAAPLQSLHHPTGNASFSVAFEVRP